jgi:hypothetical protein
VTAVILVSVVVVNLVTIAADLFAAGPVTSALVALPVVMASTAYVVGAHLNWRRGLSERAGRDHGGACSPDRGCALVVSCLRAVRRVDRVAG